MHRICAIHWQCVHAVTQPIRFRNAIGVIFFAITVACAILADINTKPCISKMLVVYKIRKKNTKKTSKSFDCHQRMALQWHVTVTPWRTGWPLDDTWPSSRFVKIQYVTYSGTQAAWSWWELENWCARSHDVGHLHPSIPKSPDALEECLFFFFALWLSSNNQDYY